MPWLYCDDAGNEVSIYRERVGYTLYWNYQPISSVWADNVKDALQQLYSSARFLMANHPLWELRLRDGMLKLKEEYDLKDTYPKEISVSRNTIYLDDVRISHRIVNNIIFVTSIIAVYLDLSSPNPKFLNKAKLYKFIRHIDRDYPFVVVSAYQDDPHRLIELEERYINSNPDYVNTEEGKNQKERLEKLKNNIDNPDRSLIQEINEIRLQRLRRELKDKYNLEGFLVEGTFYGQEGDHTVHHAILVPIPSDNPLYVAFYHIKYKRAHKVFPELKPDYVSFVKYFGKDTWIGQNMIITHIIPPPPDPRKSIAYAFTTALLDHYPFSYLIDTDEIARPKLVFYEWILKIKEDIDLTQFIQKNEDEYEDVYFEDLYRNGVKVVRFLKMAIDKKIQSVTSLFKDISSVIRHMYAVTAKGEFWRYWHYRMIHPILLLKTDEEGRIILELKKKSLIFLGKNEDDLSEHKESILKDELGFYKDNGRWRKEIKVENLHDLYKNVLDIAKKIKEGPLATTYKEVMAFILMCKYGIEPLPYLQKAIKNKPSILHIDPKLILNKINSMRAIGNLPEFLVLDMDKEQNPIVYVAKWVRVSPELDKVLSELGFSEEYRRRWIKRTKKIEASSVEDLKRKAIEIARVVGKTLII